jgi:double-stranded uracil-DNA glycosylase
MPGHESLIANQYYAYARNAFWPIMGSLLDFSPTLSYQARVNALQVANVAVWDVLKHCERQGSLDSAIKAGSRIPNDFKTFLKSHKQIRLIAFNGAEAERSFKKLIQATLNLTDIALIRLPSTSPAHTMPFVQKELAWHSCLQSIFDDSTICRDI